MKAWLENLNDLRACIKKTSFLYTRKKVLHKLNQDTLDVHISKMVRRLNKLLIYCMLNTERWPIGLSVTRILV